MERFLKKSGDKKKTTRELGRERRGVVHNACSYPSPWPEIWKQVELFKQKIRFH